MKNILLYLWQIPQHLLGLALLGVLWISGRIATIDKYYEAVPVVSIRIRKCGFGLSLGRYIFFDEMYGQVTINHERGHSIQSRFFGPLYLLIVALPSLSRNMYNRITHKGTEWYYSGWPESDADRLGGVVRSF